MGSSKVNLMRLILSLVTDIVRLDFEQVLPHEVAVTFVKTRYILGGLRPKYGPSACWKLYLRES